MHCMIVRSSLLYLALPPWGPHMVDCLLFPIPLLKLQSGRFKPLGYTGMPTTDDQDPQTGTRTIWTA